MLDRGMPVGIRKMRWLVTIGFLTAGALPVRAMEIVWTRMTGQWPSETAPLVADVNGDGSSEILILNRGGQLLLWSTSGAPIGSGDDGAVTTLPEGRWTTTPTLAATRDGVRVLACSVEGLVVCLDADFRVLWQRQLPHGTQWGRAIPSSVATASGAAYCYGDQSGTLTCFGTDGTPVWTAELGTGACMAPLMSMPSSPDGAALLAAEGSVLFGIDAQGNELWRRDLGGPILSRPEVHADPEKTLIVCGAGAGLLFGLDIEGRVLWEFSIDDEIDTSVVFWEHPDGRELVLCTGLWGGLHTLDLSGRPVWSHYYRAKGRGVPLVADTGRGTGRNILVSTYRQYVYQFGADGDLVDKVRLNGVVNSSPVPVQAAGERQTDFVVTTASLLAYRIRMGQPRSPYGESGESATVAIQPPDWDAATVPINNPNGALVTVNLSVGDESDWRRVSGMQTSRTSFEIPIPDIFLREPSLLRVRAKNRASRLLDNETWEVPIRSEAFETNHSATLTAWQTPAYATFHANQLVPAERDVEPATAAPITIHNLYQGETGQGALVVASHRRAAVQVRVNMERPKQEDGAVFAGRIILRQVIGVGTVNGEIVYDALPALMDGGVITIPARRAVKIWVSATANDVPPGDYAGRVIVSPLDGGTEALVWPLHIQVQDIELTETPPLTLCTWDYVPNQWFPYRVEKTLDDMSRHGVTVFPRSNCIPRGTVDENGDLSLDFTQLDRTLSQLEGRGEILFQVSHPPIEFPSEPTEAEKRTWEIAHLRAWRDAMREHGWDTTDYAFYPMDEPGLHYGSRVPSLIDACELFREADPSFRIYTDPVPGLSWKDFERIEELIDVWCPNMRLVSGLLSGDPRISRIMQSGKTVWSYECIAMVKSLSPLRYNRANAWRANYFGLDGIGHWTHSTMNLDPWFAGNTYNDEFALVYPGALPVPSVRWEAVRDGLEDVAAIELLEEQIERNRESGTKQDLVKRAEEAIHTAQIDIMELSDEVFMESKDYLRAGDRRIWHTRTDVDAYHEHRGRIAELTLALRGD